MSDSGTSLATPALVKVTTAGTRQQFPSSGENFTAKTILIQALSTNTEAVVVGDKNVVAKAGSQGTPEQRGIELKAGALLSIDIVDSAQIWIDSRTSKDGVTYMVLQA